MWLLWVVVFLVCRECTGAATESIHSVCQHAHWHKAVHLGCNPDAEPQHTGVAVIDMSSDSCCDYDINFLICDISVTGVRQFALVPSYVYMHTMWSMY